MNLKEIHYGIEIETVNAPGSRSPGPSTRWWAARSAMSASPAAMTPGRSRTCAAASGRWWGRLPDQRPGPSAGRGGQPGARLRRHPATAGGGPPSAAPEARSTASAASTSISTPRPSTAGTWEPGQDHLQARAADPPRPRHQPRPPQPLHTAGQRRADPTHRTASPRTKDQLNRIWYGYHNRQPQHYDNSRYHGVNLHNVWYRGTVEFRWFEATLHAGRIKAYLQFCLAVAAKALNGRAASSRKRDFDPQSAKYDFRVFLLHLGLIGDEFKTARKHLMANMPGDAAFKNGRPKPQDVLRTKQPLSPTRPGKFPASLFKEVPHEDSDPLHHAGRRTDPRQRGNPASRRLPRSCRADARPDAIYRQPSTPGLHDRGALRHRRRADPAIAGGCRRCGRRVSDPSGAARPDRVPA